MLYLNLGDMSDDQLGYAALCQSTRLEEWRCHNPSYRRRPVSIFNRSGINLDSRVRGNTGK